MRQEQKQDLGCIRGRDSVRLKSRIVRIPRREQCVVGGLALLLVFTMWALGGARLWSQWIMGILSGVCFAALFLPRSLFGGRWSRECTAGDRWRRLWRFPIFWLGLLFLGYIGLQGFNPAWKQVENAQYHWLEPIPHIEWLPSGIATPFEEMNPFRVLLIMGGVWMAVCALWAGVHHRRSLRFLFWVVCLNGAVGALTAVILELRGVERVLGIVECDHRFLGPFLYVNHAAAFWNLCLSLSLGLFMYYQRRTRLTLAGSGPHMLFLLVGLILLAGVLFSLSRLGIVLACCTVSAPLLIGLFVFIKGIRKGTILVSLIGVGIFGGLIWGLYRLVDVEAVEREYQSLWHSFREFDGDRRRLLYEATYRMFRDRQWYGWGAGSFRFYFPVYQQDYPPLWQVDHQRLFWSHAHNDWLQYLAEYGIIGCALMGLMILYIFGNMVIFCNNVRSLNLIACLGFLLLAVHSMLDFVFQSPLILLTAALVLTGSAQLQKLDSRIKS